MIHLSTWKRCRIAAGLSLAGITVATSVFVLAPLRASATTNGISIGVFPEFPTRVEVGSTNVAASINVINGSTGAEATGSVTVTDLTLVPACGNFTPVCDGAAEPGVMTVSSTGTGAAGTGCAGMAFDIAVIDSATGRVRFSRADGSPLVLSATDITTELDTCRIHFTIANHKAPAVDSYPSLGETQTNQVGFLAVRHENGNTGTDQGEDVTTIVGATTAPPPAPTTTVPPPAPTTVPPPAPTTTVPPAPTTTTTKPPAPAPTTTTVPPSPPTTTAPAPAPPSGYSSWQELIARKMYGG